MEIIEAISCPFCGQTFQIPLDTTLPSQRFTADCEICCRPLEISIQCEPGEVLSLEVQGS
ncbi:MAG: CPXCG motif-containing cysteine-rich protein [Verrucomicrobia subdivision 3 bacterium]|nr:CPXCG motif-containing cysteine-rich protein [Limisphaerales bacterium]